MQSKNHVTQKQLSEKGYTWSEKHQAYISKYQKRLFTELEKPNTKLYHSHNLEEIKVKKGRPSADETIYADKIEVPEGLNVAACKITLAGVFKGLNGSSGLMQLHWAQAYTAKKKVVERVKRLNAKFQFKGQIEVTCTRFSSSLMDWDNLGSTMKFPMDALVECKIIEDDSPVIITKFNLKQEKCRKKDQRIEILITQ